MSTGPEAPIENKVVDWAKRNGWYTLKINGMGKKGFPDHFFFASPRLLVMIEFKAPGRKPKPIQLYIHKILRALQWPVYVVDNVQQGIEILQDEKAAALKSSKGE